MVTRAVLWAVGALDALVLVSQIVALAPRLDPPRFLVLALVSTLLAGQLGAVWLALRWQGRVGMATRRSSGALTLMALALLFNVAGVFGAVTALLFEEHRTAGLAALVWTVANSAALFVAWRSRPWTVRRLVRKGVLT